MSINTTLGKESFEIAQCSDDRHTNIRNCEKDTYYTVTIEDDDAVSCTCPHFRYKVAYCKHMAAVESPLIGSDEGEDNEKEISGPYTGYDKYGNVDHTYWKCEDCGAECVDKAALEECC